jgi:endonuclease/exonuclease/phosphatase family metal-dependent hydrolase
MSFPAGPGGYPFPEPPAASWHWVSLPLAVALLPFVLLDFILYARELIRLQPSLRALGGGFLIAAALLLVLIFAHVFTTVYDYIPVVGPLFRDRFWLVYLAAGLALILPLALVRPGGALGRLALPRAFAAGVVLLAAAAVVGARATAASPAAPSANATGLRVLTYNIQQGYSADGLRNHAGQLALLRQVDADIIGLQESDTNRIAGGNADIVRYFADELDLYSYYGPKVTAGTFGIALLSKVPIENPRTFYLYSTGEQTAGIIAQIAAGGRVFNVFVTHLGNGGPIEQQRGFLREVEGRANVIAMGDFNFEPDGEQYRLTTAVLSDAWLLRWPAGIDDRGLNPADRIDHIFVSPGIAVRDARFLIGPESDHPALVVDVGW